jgi:phenylacetate-CoA ligase
MQNLYIPETFRSRPYALQHFRQIVYWVLANHPFYKARISKPEVCIPLLSRDEILDNNDALLNGHQQTGSTSGSTGVPVRFSWSQERSKKEKISSNLLLSWLGGALPRTRIVRVKDGDNDSNLFDVRKPVEEQIDFILKRFRDHQATSIITYPTNAEIMCRHILEKELDMSFVRRFSCFAETFESHHENLIKQAFPEAQLNSTYSSTELGTISVRCPHEPEFHHIMAHNMGVEILNEERMPCEDGQVGRVVITDYFNRNSPFIRYDIGDLAAPGSCPCGQTKLPALQSILGKVRGALKGPDGKLIMFSHINVVLRDIPGLRQYQVIQESLDNIRFRYVVNTGAKREGIETAVTTALHDFIGFRPKIEFEKEVLIERDPNGKFYESICRV